MTDQGWSLRSATAMAGCTFFACLVLSGCKGVPPVPAHVAQREDSGAYSNPYDPEDDEYSGRFFRTGKYRARPKQRSLERTAPTAAPPAAPAHAPAMVPPSAYPPPPPPTGYQTAVPPGSPYGQPAVPYPYAAPGYPAPGYATPAYPPQASPAGAYPTPGYPTPAYPPQTPPAGAYPTPGYPPAAQPPPYAPPAQPYPPAQYPASGVNPYAAPGQPPVSGYPVVPASAAVAIPPGESTAAADPPQARPKEEEDDGFALSDLSPNNITKTVKKAAGRGPDEDYARKQLEEGRTLFGEKKYAEAVKPLKEAADRWPASVLAEDAMFLRAESLFFTDQYPAAQDTYGQLLDDYKNSRYLDAVTRRLFAIGQYWVEQNQRDPHWPVTPNLTDKSQPRFDTFGRALRAFETIRIEDPTGPLADDSIMAIAVAYFEREQYEDASIFFDILRTEYPESEHQAKAHMLCLESKMGSYQGSHYDVTPLTQAGEIAEQTLLQFQRELGPEAEHVRKTRGLIENEKAGRDWAVAQFYDNKQQYGAARIYYRAIIEDYAHTRFAKMALSRLQELQGEPDEPANRYAWLTDAFEPEED